LHHYQGKEIQKNVSLPSNKAQTLSSRQQISLMRTAPSRAAKPSSNSLDGTILTANDNFLTLFGYAMEDLVASTTANCALPALSKAGILKHYGQIYAGKFMVNSAASPRTDGCLYPGQL
jgi:hypothetical protein